MSLDDMSDTVEDFSDPILITRRARGDLIAGRYVPKAADSIPATASVTPASAKDLLRLPEGRRVEQIVRILTTTEIQLLPDADVITYNGADWEAQTADSYGSFFDCLATKVIAS